MASNYTYKYIIGEDGQIVYPRTVLSAVDIITANGLRVEGDRLSVVYATKSQIQQGVTGSILSADGLKEAIEAYNDALYIAGGGLKITGGTISADPAEINAILARTGDLTKSVTNGNLNGALNLGRAVDVTTMPPTKNYYNPSNPWTVSTYEEYTGPEGSQVKDDCYRLQHTAPSTTGYTFWGWNVLPKFATGYRYLIIADVKCMSGFARCSINVDSANKDFEICDKDGNPITPIGSTNTMPYLTSEWKRYAKGFTYDQPDIGIWFYITTTDALDVRVKHFMVFEVTSLSDEAIYALATAEHPEQVYEKYLVQNDAVCPWVKTINMGNSTSITVQSGLSYKLYATDTNTHTLSVDTFPEDAYGKESHITIFLGSDATVLAQLPLVLMDPLVVDAANHCVIKFRDGYARVYVEDTDYGYTVTVDSGTTAGSLKYGIESTSEDYIVIANTLDGTRINFNGTVAPSGRSASILGHGTDKTILTGSASLTPTVEMHALSLADVNVTGGTMIVPSGVEMNNGTTTVSNGLVVISGGVIGNNGDVVVSGGTLFCKDAYMNDGAVISVSGGGLAVEKVTGNGGVIDLGGSSYITIQSRNTAIASGCTFTGRNDASESANGAIVASGYVKFDNCTFTGNTAGIGAAMTLRGGGELTSCVISGNTIVNYGVVRTVASAVTLNDCTISDNGGGSKAAVYASAGIIINGGTVYRVNLNNNAVCTLKGSTTIQNLIFNSGSVTISSGAIINLTGNTNAAPIAPGGRTIIEDATFLYGPTAGTVTSSATITGATFGASIVLGNSANVINTNTSSTTVYMPGNAVYNGINFDASALSWRPFDTYFSSNYTVKFIDCSFGGQLHLAVNDNRFATATLSGTFVTSANIYPINNSVSAGILILDNDLTISVDSTTTHFAATMQSITIGSGVTLNSKPLPAGVYSQCKIEKNGDMILNGAGVITDYAKLDAVISGTTGIIIMSSGAVLDLTGNSNTTPVTPGGTITFAPGGATVYPSAGQASAYMLDNVTIPKLRNDNVIDLNGQQPIRITGAAAMSGCVVSNGTNSSQYGNGGGITRETNTTLTLTGVTVTGCSAYNGGGVALRGGIATLSNCTISGNSATDGRCRDLGVVTAATTVNVVNCNIPFFGLAAGATATIAGSSNYIYSACVYAGNSGHFIISSGASITLGANMIISSGSFGTINVLTGGCTVNGKFIPAGTYTRIISAGGSAYTEA